MNNLFFMYFGMHARLVGASVSIRWGQKISTVACRRRLCAAQRGICSMSASDGDRKNNDGPLGMIERMEKGEYVPQLKEKRERVEALFSGIGLLRWRFLSRRLGTIG